MGDIKKKRKRFSRPKKLFDKVRITAENVLVERYGLKNKKEIWKAKAEISNIRQRAKVLIGSDAEEQRVFFDKLNHLGFGVVEISDVLGLTEENFLDRRLQTIVAKKKLANTPKQARQLIVHKHVLVDGDIVNTPSFVVTKELESKISLKVRKVKKVKETVKEEAAPAEEVATEEVAEEEGTVEENKEEPKAEEEKTEEAKK
jgi:small subunit ribosomal protein S4